MRRRRDLAIFVSAHAIERLRSRGLAPVGRPALAFVYGDVREAILAGRMAKNQPRWCAGDGHERNTGARHRGTLRFVWDIQQSRCYVIVRGIRDPPPGKADRIRRAGADGWTVVTVMGPR